MMPEQHSLRSSIVEALGLCDDVSKYGDTASLLAKLDAASRVEGSRIEFEAEIDYRLERVAQEIAAFRSIALKPGAEKACHKALKSLRRALRLLAAELTIRRP
jgi:hypothetical protein